ncbi:hypothetical protein P3T76_016456 [Phytophthora citrophthora]|uniref:Uncharacterized protein n=1 Tax=Phytophthora citrophthora TaxID=4793 RepID=A0AAD9FXG9_9STRA|nr:hypothetical protein P3T76_016456 [Phytophthora citrophthora]
MREKGVWWRGVATRIGRGCGRKVFGGAEWRRGYGRARVVVCVGGGRSIGRGCGRKVFGGAEWRRGYGRARVVVCVGGGRSIGRGCGRKVFGGAEWRRGLVEDAGETCLVARSGDEDWSRMREKGVWWRGVATRIGRGCGRKVFGGAEWRRGYGRARVVVCVGGGRSIGRGCGRKVFGGAEWRRGLVEDAGETCLVARSGDEGMVERVWSLVEDAGETCLVARSGDEGMVERVWSLVEDAGETCLVARSGDEDWSRMREKGVWWRGVATRIGRGCGRKVFGGAEWRRGYGRARVVVCVGGGRSWLVYPPVTRVTRVQFPDGKLLFAPTCSSALLLFCSSALLPPPTLLLFCSSALLFFAAFFPAVRAPQPTSLMLPTHSWRIGTSAAVESDSPTRTKIDTCTAPYSSLVEDAGETCLVARSGDEDWSRMREKGVWWRGVATRIGRGCGRKVFGGAEWRRGYGRARVVVCVGGGRSIGRGCGRKVFGGAEWRRGYGRARVVVCVGGGRSIGRGCGRKVFGGAEWRRGYGRARVVVCVGGGRSVCVVYVVYVVCVVCVVCAVCVVCVLCLFCLRSCLCFVLDRILVSIVVSIPACHAGDPGSIPGREASFCSHLLFCSSAPTCSSALLPPPTLLLFCSSALLLFCFAFLCRFLSCRSRTTTDISHATNAQLAHRHLCCCRIGLTNADEDRHVHGAVLVVRASLHAPSRCVVVLCSGAV